MPTTRSPKSKKSAPSAKKTAAKKASAKTPAAKRSTAKKSTAKHPRYKDPEGGLTAAGRKHFEQTEGAHLRPGVKEAKTPEQKKRKGSFLRRHFANPQGPMEKEGESTRLALSAHAWGEPVPHTKADAKKLADKGSDLLEQYHQSQDKAKSKKSAPKK